ncbi:hypothetical protein B0H10DRAFT_1962488 [Mycena sp. CBHHK59/15]|nr:hypothetical protein B0H10DRAFT_1962488 [Mycena sp. CBHHK59/15]
MSAPIVDQIQSLLAQLQELDVQDPPPQLQEHLLALQTVTSATQAKLHKHTDGDRQLLGDGTREKTAFPGTSSTVEIHSIPELTAIRPSSSAAATPAVASPFPWIDIPFHGQKPSETDSISMLGKPEPHQLIPAPAVAKPAVGCYPQAPIYTLNVELDHSYRRGWAYAAAYHPDNDFALEHDRMLNIRIPPKVLLTAFNKRTCTFHSEDIPGMVRLPMGVPLVHHINGDPKKPVTAVCGHTLDSLAQYPEGADVAALVPRLMELTWGVAATETDRGVSGIFDLDGMQRNLRSKHVNLSKLGDGNGSFNIASTRGEGEGHGMFMPAVQTNVPQAAKIIKEVLEILHKLYRLIMPLCISRFEWDMIEFNALENNVIAFGGLDPGPTSVQLNASSTANIIDLGVELLEEDEPHPLIDVDTDADEATDLLPIYHWLLQACLDSTLGDQGRPHGDPQDDTVSYTLFVLLFRAAPGSDLGTFLWMRGGIYLRELNAYIVFTAFKGHDIHCGQPPAFVKQIQDAWISLTTAQKLFKRFGPQVRCGYVLYWSQAATTHSTQIQYSRSLHFLYSPAPDKKDENRRYFITDGETILGDSDSRANRLAREGIYALKNYLQQCQLKLGFDINTLLENTTYKDECGQVQALKRAPLDIEDEQVYEMMCLYRRYYAWLQDLVGSQYSLGISKSKFKERQKEIHTALAGLGQPETVLPTEHNVFLGSRQARSTTSFPIIKSVVSRRQQGGEGVWTVILEGSSKEEEYLQSKTPWLNLGSNAQLCVEYMNKHGQRNPPSAVSNTVAIESTGPAASGLTVMQEPETSTTQTSGTLHVSTDTPTSDPMGSAEDSGLLSSSSTLLQEHAPSTTPSSRTIDMAQLSKDIPTSDPLRSVESAGSGLALSSTLLQGEPGRYTTPNAHTNPRNLGKRKRGQESDPQPSPSGAVKKKRRADRTPFSSDTESAASSDGEYEVESIQESRTIGELREWRVF